MLRPSEALAVHVESSRILMCIVFNYSLNNSESHSDKTLPNKDTLLLNTRFMFPSESFIAYLYLMDTYKVEVIIERESI